MLEIKFLVYKLKGKLTDLVAKFGGHITAHLPSVQVVVRFKTKSRMVKGIDNAFDHMGLCLV